MAPEIKSHLDALIASEKKRLSDLKSAPLELVDKFRGVLLSDEIRFLCEDYDLVTPFEQDCLRPAGYDLRVGERYAIGGEDKTLGSKGVLQLPPYQVAIVQTFETLNLPDFLIGRWNIRVKLAYKGLLWVGGAQVDPGFRGRLACPIYNLSKESVELRFGEILAMIDFVPTTPYKPGISLPFQWWNKKVLFQQYETGLESGVAEQLKAMSAKLDSKTEQITANTEQKVAAEAENSRQSVREIQSRIDIFVTLIFTVVTVLFAGLGIVATKGTSESSFVSSAVWIAAIALYFALRPYVLAQMRMRELRSQRANETVSERGDWYLALLPSGLEIGLGLLILVGSVAFHVFQASLTASQVRQASQQASQAVREVKQQREYTDQKIELLQQQLNALRAQDLNVHATVAMVPSKNPPAAKSNDSRNAVR